MNKIDPEQAVQALAERPVLTPDQAALMDAGRRLAEAHNLALMCGGQGRWIAGRLSDGGTDGKVYDTRPDAIRAQLHETQCLYVCVIPTPMPPAEAAQLILITRNAYDAGFRITGPDDPRSIIPEGRRPSWMR